MEEPNHKTNRIAEFGRIGFFYVENHFAKGTNQMQLITSFREWLLRIKQAFKGL